MVVSVKLTSSMSTSVDENGLCPDGGVLNVLPIVFPGTDAGDFLSFTSGEAEAEFEEELKGFDDFNLARNVDANVCAFLVGSLELVSGWSLKSKVSDSLT